jgi:hypothetical protein
VPSDDLLKYFIKETNKRFDDLDKKVDRLIGFRWMLVGAATAISAIVSGAFQIAQLWAGSKQ